MHRVLVKRIRAVYGALRNDKSITVAIPQRHCNGQILNRIYISRALALVYYIVYVVLNAHPPKD